MADSVWLQRIRNVTLKNVVYKKNFLSLESKNLKNGRTFF